MKTAISMVAAALPGARRRSGGPAGVAPSDATAGLGLFRPGAAAGRCPCRRAGVQLGVVPPGDAAIVAQERCVAPGDIVDSGQLRVVELMRSLPSSTPPAYLEGRFGA
jgi:hypothetical protein